MEFRERLCRVVMDCITSPLYSFVINGCVEGLLIPQRGLRQGFPLSPYIFLLCAEGFSALIRKAESDKNLMGFECRLRGPQVRHIFFADDSMLFGRTIARDVNTIAR